MKRRSKYVAVKKALVGLNIPLDGDPTSGLIITAPDIPLIVGRLKAYGLRITRIKRRRPAQKGR